MPRISLSMVQLLRCFLLALLVTDVCMVTVGEQPQRNLDNQGDEHKKELANLKRVVELLRAQNQQYEDKVADLTRENENLRAQNRQSETTLSKLMASPGGPSFGGKGGSHGYHHFYEIALARFRHLPGLRLLEIGVDQGESLLLWLQYFSSLAPDGVQGLECAGPGCSHVGVRGKIADACRHREILGCERVRVFFGDQADEEFLRHVVANGAGLRPEDTRHDWSRGGWDLVIDDGGHIPRDQLTSFCALFPFVRPGGLYVIEDVETSYWDGPGAVAYGRPFPGAGLGKQAPGNFVEAMKQLVDVINRGWFFSPEYTVLGEHIDHSIASISFHGGLIAVQKKTVEHRVYPFQHYCEKDKARFVDLDAVQARIRSLHQVRLEERVRKTKEEEECLGDTLACTWTRTRQRWKRPWSNENAEWALWPWPWGSPPPPDNDDPPLAGRFIVNISHGGGDMQGLLSATEGLPVPLVEPSVRIRISGLADADKQCQVHLFARPSPGGVGGEEDAEGRDPLQGATLGAHRTPSGAGDGESAWGLLCRGFSASFACGELPRETDVAVCPGIYYLGTQVISGGEVVHLVTRRFEVLSRDDAQRLQQYRSVWGKPTDAGNRAAVINSLIALRQYTSYLEIGTELGLNFEAIQCARKECVDPIKSYEHLTHQMTSDQAFSEFRAQQKAEIVESQSRNGERHPRYWGH